MDYECCHDGLMYNGYMYITAKAEDGYMYVFKKEKDIWHKWSPPLKATMSHKLAVWRHYLYIYGGLLIEPYGALNRFLRIDLNLPANSPDLVWKSLGNVCPLRGHTLHVIGDYLYVILGCKGKLPQTVSTIRRFDLRRKYWSVYECDIPRVGHSSVVYDGHIWIFGGWGKHKLESIYVWKYNIKTGVLTRVEPIGKCPNERYSHNSWVTDKSFFIAGGDKDCKKYYNDVWEYVFKTNCWIEHTSLPNKLSGSTAIVDYSTKIVYLHGGEMSPIKDHYDAPIFKGVHVYEYGHNSLKSILFNYFRGIPDLSPAIIEQLSYLKNWNR